MSNAYIIVLKSKTIFNSQILKVQMFKTFEKAYEYGNNIEPGTTKEIIYTREEVQKNRVLWITSKNIYPQQTCKIYSIPNDKILNIYLSCPNEKIATMVQYLYINLKMNNLI